MRQHQCRLRALHFRLPCRDHFHPRSDEYVGKLGVRNGLGRLHLVVFGQRFRIVDLDQHRARSDVLAALDGNLADPSVHARRDIEPRCIDLALNEQWFGS